MTKLGMFQECTNKIRKNVESHSIGKNIEQREQV